MREFTTPAATMRAADANLTDWVFDNAVQAPDSVAFRRKVAGAWQPVTAASFAEQVRSLAAGFINAGIGPGDRVGLFSKTRYEWTLVDYALWAAGAVPVPIYETSSPEQVAWNLGDSGAVAVVAETDTHRDLVGCLRSELTALRHIWHIEAGDLNQLAAAGSDLGADAVERRRRSVTGDRLATIIYTSGTTGRPKGCMVTHRNFMFDAVQATAGLGDVLGADACTLLFLPLAHVFARIIQIGCVFKRVTLGHSPDVRNLVDDLAEFQPTFVLAVPRVFEKIYNAANARADERSVVGKRIFRLADVTAVAYSQALEAGRPGPVLSARHRGYDRLVYAKLRDRLGGKVRYAISGGAPLGPRLSHFFRGAGITVLEAYGMTETSGAVSLNLPHALRVGTVGRPMPGESVRIAEDGEILVLGQNVFDGYWRNDEATKQTLGSDGWLHTGDIGELDDDGFLRVTSRKKEIIVTAAGKNVAPAVLEDRLRSHPLISQCMVVGDRRPYVAALVTVDEESLDGWKRSHGKPADAAVADLREDPDLRNDVQKAIDDANRAVSQAESIRRFLILPVDFTEEGGQLTPTMKLKRDVVAREFGDEIEALYAH